VACLETTGEDGYPFVADRGAKLGIECTDRVVSIRIASGEFFADGLPVETLVGLRSRVPGLMEEIGAQRRQP
jgi:hypothetical protein